MLASVRTTQKEGFNRMFHQHKILSFDIETDVLEINTTIQLI